MYIWQTKAWPNFVFSTETVKPRLDDVLALQKQLVGKAKSLPENIDQEAEMDTDTLSKVVDLGKFLFKEKMKMG